MKLVFTIIITLLVVCFVAILQLEAMPYDGLTPKEYKPSIKPKKIVKQEKVEAHINIQEAQALKHILVTDLLKCSESCECQLNITENELTQMAVLDVVEAEISNFTAVAQKYFRVRYLVYVLQHEDDCQIRKTLHLDLYNLLLNNYKMPEPLVEEEDEEVPLMYMY